MKVRALEKCFIDNILREEGEVFEYAKPSNQPLYPWLAPDTETGPKRKVVPETRDVKTLAEVQKGELGGLQDLG